MMRETEPRPVVDIDRDRLREIVSEAYRMVSEHLGEQLLASRDEVMARLEAQVSSGMTSAIFVIPMASPRVPDLKLRVDPRRREVLLLSGQKKVAARMNRYMRILG
jgi:hypothetical protein